jgi:hypothetical protein
MDVATSALWDRPDRSFEAGLAWIKSSFSLAQGSCVEVASLPDGGVGVRDSKNPSGPVLRFTPDEWRAFLGGARNGEFDRLGRCQGKTPYRDQFAQEKVASADASSASAQR